jgi:erythronate-4-phosphate dehydrogenase
MIRVIADENIPFLKGVLEPLAEVVYLPGKQITKDVVRNADALLIRTRTVCNEQLLKGTHVKFIGTATIGFDHIDTDYCKKRGIKWVNAPGCNSSSVQQYVSAALLRIAAENDFYLRDKSIGIIGVGHVGSKVEKFARTMGMRILLNDPPRSRREKDTEFYDLATVLEEADLLTLHVPLIMDGQDRTYHMFNKEIFGKIRKEPGL